MGVRGVQTFIENNGGRREVEIDEEIRMWKRRNPNCVPIIVFDILGFCYTDQGLLCGGSNNDFDESMESWFIRLKKCGAKLIFIQSLAVEIAREDQWIERRNKDFQCYREIYLMIDKKVPPHEIVSKMEESCGGSRVSPNLAPIASKHGEYLFVRAGRDCDFEVADYATKCNAMAIFSSDTDFLIFDGNWKFWNFKDLDFEKFTAFEYDRLAISRLLSISYQHRPLLATLIGNDFTKSYSDELYHFHRGLGRPSDKFRNVANYIRRNIRGADLSEDDIDFIASDVFGGRAKRQLIRDSVNSYDLHSQIDENWTVDPIEAYLIGLSVKAVKNYRKLNINSILSITTPFNDMATAECSKILIEFLVELLRKKMGIMCHDVADEKTFKILTKMSRAENFASHHESPIAPECPIPVLIDLLTKDDSDEELNETRWNLLAWMLSISEKRRDDLRSMEKEFRVSCATLLALVQRKILSIKAADGILITETAVKRKQLDGKRMPQFLQSYYVRTAHIYRTVHSDINYGFITAGLITSISDLFTFDGVYYQNLMAATSFPKDLFKAIQPYRIYAE